MVKIKWRRRNCCIVLFTAGYVPKKMRMELIYFPMGEITDNLSVIVNRYLPIKVDNDGKYPQFICPGCHIQLEATKSFMDLIVEGQTKLRDLYRLQQETLHREEKQRQKLEEALHTVNPNSTVETYTIHSDETGEKFLIQIYSDGPLFPPDHELALRAEGLERPRRKRGRPPKQISEPSDKQNESKNKVEESQQKEENEIDADGRRRRRIKAPSQYQGIVQGKELDMIFKEEGVIDEEEEAAAPIEMQSHEEVFQEVIGRVETETGEDLDQPVISTKSLGKRKPSKKRYQCEICKREFIHAGRYELHKKSHKVEYACQEFDCGVENKTREELDKHQSETGHTGITVLEKVDTVGLVELTTVTDIAKETTNETIEEATEAKHVCLDCDKTFTCKQNLDVHNRAVHNQEKPFACDKCSKMFSYANSLKLHKLNHDKDTISFDDVTAPKEYICNVCEKIFQHPSSLLYHKETEHSNGRRFVCNKCDKSFKHKQLLQRHQLVHSGRGRSSAKYAMRHLKHMVIWCGQSFAHRTSLSLHQRWHDGHKPFTCDVCNKSFSQKGNLAEHKRIHTGEKPFCCDHCGRSFTTSSQFKLHRKRHTGERPWNKNRKDVYGDDPVYELKDNSLLQSLDETIKIEVLQLRTDKRCRSSQGLPAEATIQGLLPDGTLVPIDITAIQEKHLTEEASEGEPILLNQDLQNEISMLKEDGATKDSDVDPNIHFITGEDGREVCLVTYALGENSGITQDLPIDTFLIHNIKK
ncbi:hypothetical protein NQ317_000337 [Molorchus minor]|uniref:C2H2-type domain-containing protein n=1 Tax=Molorchus minor TaxID=1323400 RepID=A0ABQ9K174_9CUCU|nr:hypothetical protein NQ317_000337 [Molorchus minor]